MDTAMRFDLVDLQLFIAVADARSITQGALRAHLALASASARIKGLGSSPRRDLAQARPPRRRADRGGRKPARSCPYRHVDAMRGDLAAFASGAKASVHLLANTSGLSEHLPKALAAFLRERPDINVDIEERESTDIAAAIVAGAADIGFAAEHALPEHVERFLFSEDRLTLVAARRSAFAGRRQIDFGEVTACDFVGLTNSTALQSHIAKHAASLGARLRFRARLRDFDAICQMVAAGVGIAVVPEAAAKRCARSMPILMIKIRDPWANRRLAICARSFKTLPRPAKHLAEFLRKAER
jgi:DNA-binding transcriptional LysR family regulator